LCKHENWKTARTIEDVAKMAKTISGSIGFTLHPDFPKAKYANAFISYDNRSHCCLSWDLYLWDEKAAMLPPYNKDNFPIGKRI